MTNITFFDDKENNITYYFHNYSIDGHVINNGIAVMDYDHFDIQPIRYFLGEVRVKSDLEKVNDTLTFESSGFTQDSHNTTKITGNMYNEDVDSWNSERYFKFLSSLPGPSLIADTRAFQVKYGLWDKNVFGFLPEENMKVKLGHLDEEMAEIKKAYENKDLNEFCDGILDLVYVALGTLNLMNMPVDELWTDIQIRNMNKVRATAENMGKRGSTFDVIKPEGWQGPRTAEIINEYKRSTHLKEKV